MSLTILEVEADSEQFEQVLALAAANRRYLGFLPNAGFADRAHKGTLLAAVDGDRVVGYVLYDLPGERVKIVHLCVRRTQRRGGISRALIHEVSTRHSDRRGLELACRRDYPAAKIWPALGFCPVAERRGRSYNGHPLTIWLLAHDHEDLFTVSEGRREIAAIDNNIFKDLTSKRKQGAATRHLNDDWISELIELCATDELLHEINRCEDEHLRQQMQVQASSYRTLVAHESDWKRLVAVVAECVPLAGDADHRHVARAVAGGAVYFITRDQQILAGAQGLHDTLRIDVVRPESLILHLDRMRSTGDYEPEALHGTSVESVNAGEISQRQFTVAFLNYGAGERAPVLRENLRGALATPKASRARVYRSLDGSPLGTLIIEAEEHQVSVKMIRVTRADRVGRAVARQLAFLPRQFAAEQKLPRVVIEDRSPSPAVLRSLPDEHYQADAKGRWICEVRCGIHRPDELAPDQAVQQDSASPKATATCERQHWPLKISGASLRTFMIAIHPTWAAQLFDTNLANATLFRRSLSLGLSREHVYYRRPGWPGGLASPARIFWYVKGGTSANPVGYLAAISQLAEVVLGPPGPLYRRFARLGVWDEQQVRSAADPNNTVMALRFIDTELFQNPLELETLRAVYTDAGLSFKAPQSPTHVPEHMFCLLYRRASAYGS